MVFVNTVKPNTANSAMTAIDPGSRTNPDYCSGSQCERKTEEKATLFWDTPRESYLTTG